MSGKKIHFMGIGGVGMAGLAVLMKAEGNEVSGCDKYATDRTRWLESLGIPVALGHDPSHVEEVDEVIVTPAVHNDNPEFLAAKHLRYRGEVLAEIVSSRESIAVCGSHGKTTTSTFIAKLLKSLGEDVAWAIGGETGSFPVAGTGKGVLVVEADESDGTLALYHATTLVVTNCEYDHPDHFKTPEAYFECYETAKKNAREVVDVEMLWRCDVEMLGAREDFRFLKDLPLHNQKNARAAVEVALRRGHSLEEIAKVLPEVVAELPDRRFQQIWPNPNTQTPSNAQTPLVVTDYAHHPTEMKCAVGMARAKCRGKLRVLFQPHRYSRTKALLNDFPAAFEGADEVVLCPTYAAFESPIEGGDIADLYQVCREKVFGCLGVCGCLDSTSPRYFLARTIDEAWEHARNSMQEGDLTLLLGAGDIIKLVPKVVEDCSRMASDSRGSSNSSDSSSSSESSCSRATRPTRKILIGAGSNTWKSDLNLSVEYVKTNGPAGRPGAALVAEHPTLIPWMAGIPGTVGGWIKMNAGAFGHSISEVLEAVKVDGEWIPAESCGFDYRKSNITGEIQDFRLKEVPDSEIKQSNNQTNQTISPADYLAKRKKFPPGTKGSVFKNPPNDYAGRLLEAADCKGLRVGGAYVWEEHANVIVAGEGSVPSDFLALAQIMKTRVKYRLGIDLEPEVQGLGNE